MVLKGVAMAGLPAKNHLITSTIEHPSILKACSWLERNGFRLTYLPVTADGLVRPEDLAAGPDPRHLSGEHHAGQQ